MNDLIINGKSIDLPKIMRNLNFVEDVRYYTKNFVRIYVESNQLFIGHVINKSKTPIKFSDLNQWIKYFDR